MHFGQLCCQNVSVGVLWSWSNCSLISCNISQCDLNTLFAVCSQHNECAARVWQLTMQRRRTVPAVACNGWSIADVRCAVRQGGGL
jgi:hypothetical protein